MIEATDVYEPAVDEDVSDTVIRALADSKGTDPARMDLRLYDLVDPDALDALFDSSADTAGRLVAFSAGDSRVVVDGSRRVRVTVRNGEPGHEKSGHEKPVAADP